MMKYMCVCCVCVYLPSTFMASSALDGCFFNFRKEKTNKEKKIKEEERVMEKREKKRKEGVGRESQDSLYLLSLLSLCFDLETQPRLVKVLLILVQSPLPITRRTQIALA